jgi:hypothetical protein
MASWNVLLVAAAVAGGAMLIENGQRVDTSPPDDEVIASEPAHCTVVRAVVYQERISQTDENALREKAAAVPSGCADR